MAAWAAPQVKGQMLKEPGTLHQPVDMPLHCRQTLHGPEPLVLSAGSSPKAAFKTPPRSWLSGSRDLGKDLLEATGLRL